MNKSNAIIKECIELTSRLDNKNLRGERRTLEEIQMLRKLEESTIDELSNYLDKNNISTSQFISRNLEKAAIDLDFSKVKFLYLFFFKKEGDESIINGVSKLVNNILTKYSEEDLSVRPHIYIIEQSVDVLSYFPLEKTLPILKEICLSKVKEKDVPDFFPSINKSLGVLSRIKSSQTLEIVKKCANHPSDDIREEAEDVLDYWEEI